MAAANLIDKFPVALTARDLSTYDLYLAKEDKAVEGRMSFDTFMNSVSLSLGAAAAVSGTDGVMLHQGGTAVLGTATGIAAFVAANGITLAGVAGALTATAPSSGNGVGWTITASNGIGGNSNGAGLIVDLGTPAGLGQRGTLDVRSKTAPTLDYARITVDVLPGVAPSATNLQLSADDGAGGATTIELTADGTGAVTGSELNCEQALDAHGFDFTIKGFAGVGTNRNGGSLILVPGDNTGSGADGKVIIRQPGGTAAVNEVQISHDGTNVYFNNPGGSTYYFQGVADADNFPFITSGTDECSFGLSGNASVRCFTRVQLRSSSVVFGTLDGTSGFDTSVTNVITLLNSSQAAGGWLQNTAGDSRVNAPVTVSGTTPSAITGLSATVIAGRKYGFEIVLNASNDVAADGFRVDFDGGTATMTSFFATGFYYAAAGAAFFDSTTALATDLVATNFANGAIILKGGFVVNAAGTFVPRIAEEDAAGGGTGVVVAVNSTMRVWDIA